MRHKEPKAQIIGKIYKGVYGCLLINWDFIRKFGGEKGGRGEGFLESKRGRGAVFWGGEVGRRFGERRVVGLCG